MAKSAKPIQLVKGHRTKKEKQVREKAEKALASGSSFKEWDKTKADTVAHKEFMRLKKLFKAIKKDDALHESAINRYCQLHSECDGLENMMKDLYKAIEDLRSSNLDPEVVIDAKIRYLDKILASDKKLMDKRAAMLAIEKENIMTIASVLRSIPKKPEEEKAEDPMAVFLKNRG